MEKEYEDLYVTESFCGTAETNKTSYHFSRLGRIIREAETKLKNSGIAHPTREQIAAETGISYLVINNAITANNIGDTLYIDDVSSNLTSNVNIEREVEENEIKKALAKAPTHINPAWPRLSSPEKPMTRFRETAMTIQAQIGTSNSFSRREIVFSAIMFWIMK